MLGLRIFGSSIAIRDVWYRFRWLLSFVLSSLELCGCLLLVIVFLHVSALSLVFLITAKEYLCTQLHPQGSRQRYQKGEANQVRLDARYGPQVSEKPEIRQEVQRFKA
jgi:hypothetical protein